MKQHTECLSGSEGGQVKGGGYAVSPASAILGFLRCLASHGTNPPVPPHHSIIVSYATQIVCRGLRVFVKPLEDISHPLCTGDSLSR